jgi:hypothetical protein
MRYIIPFAVLSFLAIAIAISYSNTDKDTPSTPPLTSTTAQTSSEHASLQPRTPPEGWKEYVSMKYMFSLFYPADMKVSEKDEGAGASTITFQIPEKAEGFQIFITPYAEAQVSEAQFRKDIPSGVRENLVTVGVDGAVGAAFYSKDATLGETREVWFVKNTYLYETTTLKPLEQGLDAVIASWKFI